MKNMRKLIPAIAMLLVSAVMMSTASFAWFTQASAADISGMQVKAVADGGLAIAAGVDATTLPQGTDYKSRVTPKYVDGAGTITDGIASATLKPATHSGSKWFTAVGTQVDNFAHSGAYTEVTGTTHGNYMHTTLYVKSLSTTAVDLQVANIAVTLPSGASATTSELNKAIRVALCVNGSSWYYFAPTRVDGDKTADANPFMYSNGSAPVEYTLVDTATHNTSTLTAGKLATSSQTNVNILDNLAYEGVAKVDVYIYYEGEDFNCISAYALSTNSLAGLQINFTAN